MAKNKIDSIDSYSGLFLGDLDAAKTTNQNNVVVQKIETVAPESKLGRPKTGREIKKRILLMMLPSIYEDFTKLAYMERCSTSELAARCFSEMIEKNKDKLDAFEEENKTN